MLEVGVVQFFREIDCDQCLGLVDEMRDAERFGEKFLEGLVNLVGRASHAADKKNERVTRDSPVSSTHGAVSCGTPRWRIRQRSTPP